MSLLKSTSEPIMILHEVYGLVAGGGTIAATSTATSWPMPVQAALPFAVKALVTLWGVIDRRYVSPYYLRVANDAAKVGVTLPSEDAVKADIVKVISADPAPAVVEAPAPAVVEA